MLVPYFIPTFLMAIQCVGAVSWSSRWTSLSPITRDTPQDIPIPRNGHWVDAWTTMPQLTEPANLPPPPFNGTDSVFYNTTIRQTIRITIGSASHMRLSISNAFGTTPLPITAATIALPLASSNQNRTGSSQINTTTLHHLTFSNGNPTITLPPASLALSDPIPLITTPGQILSISLYLATGQSGSAITSHPGSRTTTWLTPGDHTTTPNLLTSPGTTSLEHWYFITALTAWTPRTTTALSILGDSLTDGRGANINTATRWPDILSTILLSSSSSSSSSSSLHHQTAISNLAAGGNRVLAPGLGPSALSRLDRDVLAHPHVATLLLFTGINDIGVAPATRDAQRVLYDALIAGYVQLATRARAQGIARVLGATLTPFGCAGNTTLQPYAEPERERTRRRVNGWVRGGGGGVLDGVVDFDRMVRREEEEEEDGEEEGRLREEFDSGDCLHLNPRGYRAMAEGFPLEVLESKVGSGFV